jgi:hypothetical protein
MAGGTPDIKIIIDDNNDAVSTDGAQGPIVPTNLVVTTVEKPTIQVITPPSDSAVHVMPVDNIDHITNPLQVATPVIVLESDGPDVQVSPISGDYAPSEYLATMRASSVALDAFRAVTQLASGMVKVMDPTNEQDRRGYLGITLNSAAASQKTQIVTQGLITNQLWDWTTGPVHSTADGVLTQLLTEFTYEVGTAVSAKSIYVGRTVAAAATGGVDTFIFTTVTASTEWNIVHNMGRYPEVTLVDSSNRVMMADITYININTVRVDFAYATGGSAYLV